MNPRWPGVYVGIEGIEGAGKTTVVRLLAEALAPPVRVVREPGGTPLGEEVRRLLLHEADMSPWAEVALFAAARAELVAAAVRPALARGETVLSDRTYLSSLAYQGAGRGLGMAAVRTVNEIVLAGTVPDVVAVIDVDPDVGLDRQLEVDRIGGHGTGFLGEVAAAYRSLADGDRVVLVDGRGGLADVRDRLLAVLAERGIR